MGERSAIAIGEGHAGTTSKHRHQADQMALRHRPMTFLRKPDVPGFCPSWGCVRLVSYPMPLMLAVYANLPLHAFLPSSVKAACMPRIEHAAGSGSVTCDDGIQVSPHHLVCSP